MADFLPAQPARIIRGLHSYWDGLRQGRAIPARTDIRPEHIGRALNYAFILERVAPGAARFRLAGQHLIDLMGMEVRGMPLCAVLNPSSRGRFSDVLETVFRAPQLASFHLLAAADYARPELAGQMLIMPLRSDLGDVTRALGCLISQGETGIAPRRFDIRQDAVLPLIEGGEVMDPSATLSAPKRQPGFAERPAAFDPAAARTQCFKPVPAPKDIPQTPDERRALFRVIGDGSNS